MMMFCYDYCFSFLPVSSQKENLSMAMRHSFPWDLSFFLQRVLFGINVQELVKTAIDR